MADIVRKHGAAYTQAHGTHAPEVRILSAIASCRTAVLGGHRYRCSGCGKEELGFNSCRNRHCPQCLGSKTGRWLAARAQELLPVPYFHCVFTLPSELRLIVLRNRAVAFDILFRAAAETLQTVARDTKHLGAELGFFGILHTWTQKLEFHPHVHFVLPAGGVREEQWIACRSKKFFLPVKVLSAVFRGKFIAYLKDARRRGILKEEQDFDSIVAAARATPWVVYCKPPFASPTAVLKYLSRYTHRIAISNRRILGLSNGVVSFSARAARGQHGKRQTIRLGAVEFLRRFLLHRVPKQFTRIRHFGFLANRNRTLKLALVRSVLKAAVPAAPLPKPWLVCCACKATTWIVVATITPCNSS